MTKTPLSINGFCLNLTCKQLGASFNYSKNFKELRWQEEGFFVNGWCQLKIFNYWLLPDSGQDFFLKGVYKVNMKLCKKYHLYFTSIWAYMYCRIDENFNTLAITFKLKKYLKNFLSWFPIFSNIFFLLIRYFRCQNLV